MNSLTKDKLSIIKGIMDCEGPEFIGLVKGLCNQKELEFTTERCMKWKIGTEVQFNFVGRSMRGVVDGYTKVEVVVKFVYEGNVIKTNVKPNRLNLIDR